MRVSAFLLPLALAAAVPAQTKPTVNPLPTPAIEVVPEATPEERIQALKDQLARLEAERAKLDQVEKTGGVVSRVKGALAERQVVVEPIDDPNPRNVSMGGGAATANAARLLSDEEKKALPGDVILVVDGVPATVSEFDAAMAYLQSYPNQRDEDAMKKQAILELIRQKAAEAAFPDTAPTAEAKILELQKKLKAGEDFAKVAKEQSDCPSSQRGGDLGKFGRVGMDFWFTKTSYGLKVGEVSDVVQSTFGYHLIKVTAIEKGETPEQDKVQASHILALYSPNQGMVRQVSQRVHAGKSELAFASEEYLAYAPDVYRN